MGLEQAGDQGTTNRVIRGLTERVESSFQGDLMGGGD